jgi:three-Cys-motif partner protein
MPREDERYLRDSDGLLVEKVGPWAKKKLKIVTDYAYAAGGARRNYVKPGSAYIDVFCGPGRSRIRTSGEFIDGSPIAAYKKAMESPQAFTSLYISDARSDLLQSAEGRLIKLGAPVHAVKGPASVAMRSIVRKLNPQGLHFAFLDPHNLGALSFDLFESLATLKRIDIIVHVSLSDLQRNADRYTSEAHDHLTYLHQDGVITLARILIRSVCERKY